MSETPDPRPLCLRPGLTWASVAFTHYGLEGDEGLLVGLMPRLTFDGGDWSDWRAKVWRPRDNAVIEGWLSWAYSRTSIPPRRDAAEEAEQWAELAEILAGFDWRPLPPLPAPPGVTRR